MKFDFKKIFPHIIALLVFIAISAVYFLPQFQGKELYKSDTVNHKAMAKESKDFYEKTGEITLWTNSMFGGMPTYQISAPQNHNYLRQVKKGLELGFARPAGYFILGMISIYILFITLGFNYLLGIIGAIAFAYLTNNMFLYQAGHMTKLVAIMMGPIVLAGVILTLKKKYVLGGLIFAIGMGLEFFSNHFQMTYYLAFVIAILVIIEFIRFIKLKELKTVGIVSAVLLIGIVLALGSSASKLWTTYEYAKDTMRGKPILKKEGKATSSSQTNGLEWGYAMQWSNGALDIVSSFIPGVVGGGSSEKISKKSHFAKDYKRLTRRNLQSYNAPLYWGSLPFTSGPPYMGALIFFLFVIGLLAIKDRYKWWAFSSVLLLYLLSMGKNLEFLNKLFFDYFPFYNKFRTPNSIMGIAGIPLVFFAIYTLKYIIKGDYDKDQFLKKLYISTGILGGISLFFAFVGPSVFDFTSTGDGRLKELASSIILDRKSIMTTDSLRTLAIILIGTGLIWAFVKEKLSETILISGIAVVVLFDIITVDQRYINHSDFLKSKKITDTFKPRAVDQQILNDDDELYFRVLDYTINPFNNAKPSYFFKNLGGYHAAKLQRAQDMIDYYIKKGNRTVLNMMNTKYIIQKQNDKEVAAKNPDVMGNAWFVNSFAIAKDANDEIDLIGKTDVKNTAIVNKEFESYIKGVSPQSSGSVILNDYAPNKLVYNTENSGEGFIVFSEVWYGPNKGWQAYVDSKPVDHIRVNYWLRGLKVPAGKHNIVFEFKPKSYYVGETISMMSSLIMILMFLGYIGFYFYKRK